MPPVTQQIPLAVSDAPPQTRQTIQSIVTVLNSITGNGTSAAVRRSELAAAGIISAGVGGITKPNGGIIAIPKAITGFSVMGGFGSLLLSWDAITQIGFSHVEIWRSLIDDISTATMVGTAVAPMYADTPPDSKLSITYYYWVRAVNSSGIAGAYNAVAGTAGSTANDPAYMLGVLTNQLTKTQLHQSLSSPIDMINTGGLFGSLNATPQSGLLSPNSLVATDSLVGVAGLLIDTIGLQTANTNAISQSNVFSADALLANAVSNHDKQVSHFANKANIATVTQTANTFHTALVSEATARVQLEAKLNASTALYSSSSTAAADALTAVVGKTTTMTAHIDANTANINDATGVVATKVDAEAAKRLTLQAAILGTVVDPQGMTLATLTSGMIHEEKVSRVSDVGSINTTLSTIQGAVDVAGSINHAVNQSKNSANAYADSAVSTSKDTLRAEFNSISNTWQGATDPALANYIHVGDIWYDDTMAPHRWGLSSSGSIDAATVANPVSITSAANGLSTGQRIQITAVGGMVELNQNYFTITVVDANTFTLGVDGTAFTAFIQSGIGVWQIGAWQLVQDKIKDTLTASIVNEAKARATANEATTTRTNTMSSGISLAADALLNNALSQDSQRIKGHGNAAAIQVAEKTVTDKVKSEASRIDALVTGFTSPDGTINTALIQAKDAAIATANSAMTTQVGLLQAKMPLGGGTVDAAVGSLKAALVGTAASVQDYLTTNNYAVTSDITTQLSNYDPTAYAGFALAVTGVQVKGPGGINSTISNLSGVMFGTDMNGNPLQLATAVKQVSINDGLGGAASLETKMTALRSDTGKLQSEYTIKTDVNGKIAGFGIANNGVVSDFEITADKFWIAPPAGSAAGRLSPFVVDATTNMVRMDGASIVNATITNAHIGWVDGDIITAAVGLTSPYISGGMIVLGNAVTLNSGSGIYIDGQTAGGLFRVGNPAGNNISWDGANLNITGKIIAGAGSSVPYTNISGTKPPSNATNGATTAQANKLNGIATGADNTTTIINGGVVSTSYLYLGAGGNIRSGKGTYADNANGFWLGHDAGTPKFKLKGTSGSLVFDGANIIMTGDIQHNLSASTTNTYFTTAVSKNVIMATIYALIRQVLVYDIGTLHVRMTGVSTDAINHGVSILVHHNGVAVLSMYGAGNVPDSSYYVIAVAPGDTVEVFAKTDGYALGTAVTVGATLNLMATTGILVTKVSV